MEKQIILRDCLLIQKKLYHFNKGDNKAMTVKKLFEFAKKYNLEDAQLQFHDGCYFGINHASVRVDMEFPDQNRITLSE